MIGIYIRVSTQNQVNEGYSLEAQEDLCMKRASELGHSKSQVRVYREEGRSGEDIDRPMMNQLREDTANGIITTVIITDPDRLTRDLTDKLIVCKEWDRQYVDIIFIDTEYQNTPEGQMFFNMRSVFAQFELAQIRKRTIRGRLRAVEKDKKIMPMRTAPYGYDYKDGKLLINIQEAEFVKKIYDWYLIGLTLREIGGKLFNEGAVPKRKESKNFGASSISRILTSEIYIGKYVYNKRETKKAWGERTASGNQRKTYKLRDEANWIRVDVPAIIDEKTYILAQNKRVNNKRKGGNIKFDYLFRGMIRCKHCGRIWECTTYNGRKDKTTGEMKKYAVYRCPNLNPKRYGDGIEKCKSQSIRIDLLEKYIMDLIYRTLSNKEMFKQVIKNQLLVTDDTLDDEILELEKQLKRKIDERDRIKRMYVVAQVITEEEMLKDMKKINPEIKKITDDIDKLNRKKENQVSNQITDEYIDLIIRNIEKMFENEDMMFKDKRQLMELLIDEITIDGRSEKIGITIQGLLDDIALWSHCQEV
ncbi:recombinase family protein [Neobacillus sp. PS3-40]|uniref:recombinase family protein n=1 Tax=Neobacillus sp. PS3-40 TaxID=3070679 RepID=UPI0027E142A8|nr:recombinase family protein [Neobacillus sp. PS3-40]WML45472.1 recombinase family protein [Neobacillus sp. PS3-40]